jgi:2'-5' RNA ligase
MRLFVAIELPDAIKDSINRICTGIIEARWVPEEQMHLTLRFIGEVDGGKFTDINNALGSIRESTFPLALKGVGYFPPRKDPRILWIGVEHSEKLRELQNKIEHTVKKCGIKPERRKYHPHITIARLRDYTWAEKVVPFIRGHSMFASEPFNVEQFILYSSQLTKYGAIHTVERAYPLTAPLDDV